MKDKFDPVNCNMCGLSCAQKLSSDYAENGGMIDIQAIGGYSSTPGNGDGALDDMTKYTFSLCEFCLDFMFSNFVIPPIVCEVGFAPPPHINTGIESDIIELNEIEEFVPAKLRVACDDWRKQKEEFLFRKIARDNKRKIIAKDDLVNDKI